MASSAFVWVSLLLASIVQAYLDHGSATTLRIETRIPTIPHHLAELDLAKATGAHPSLITAIAPLITPGPYGEQHTLYSIYYNKGAREAQRRLGKGVFKRGVFASDPPFPTCTPCGGDGAGGYTSSYNSDTGFSTRPECTTIPYNGVFKSRDPRSSTFCFGSSYSGIFTSPQTSSYTLPCCFTTPESCLANRTSSTTPSYSFTSGVFVSSTTYTSNSTVSTFTAPPSTAFTMTSSTRNSSSPPGDFSLGLNSLSASGTLSSTSPSASSGTGLSYSGSLSSRSSFSVSALTTTSASLQSRPSTSSFNILVISSTTITLSVQPVSSSSSTSIITVITISPSDGSGTSSASTRSDATTAAPPSITTAPVTVEGCGTVTGGSGTVSGSGTVYPALAPFFPVTSVGIASGSAPLVVGCGVLIGTGTFIGSASITGCGEGNGTATLTGSGTVWPAIAGRDQTTLSFTSSGIISGSGRVSGCGTLTGSGTFTITDVYTPIPTASRSTVTVEVYASYCGPSEDIGAFGLNRIASNGTSDPLSDVDAAAADKDSTNRFHNDTVTFSSSLRNATDPSANNSTQKTDPNPSCIECPNSGGICCPFDYPCDSVGKCPWEGILAAGYVRFGYNMVMARNLSDGSQVWDEGVSPEAAGVGRVEGGDVPEEVAAARQMYGGAAAAAAGGGVGLGGVGMGVFGGMGQRVAPHPMGGDVGSVLAKRDKEARREEERHRADMQRRGVAEEPHDFVVRADA